MGRSDRRAGALDRPLLGCGWGAPQRTHSGGGPVESTASGPSAPLLLQLARAAIRGAEVLAVGWYGTVQSGMLTRAAHTPSPVDRHHHPGHRPWEGLGGGPCLSLLHPFLAVPAPPRPATPCLPVPTCPSSHTACVGVNALVLQLGTRAAQGKGEERRSRGAHGSPRVGGNSSTASR